MKRSLLALTVALMPLLSCSQKKEAHRLPINKTQTAVLYDDGTWRYVNGTAAAATVRNTAARALPVTTPAPAPTYRPSSASYSGSPTCGAPTKKGGYCRRKVRGGGYCWQHS
ncbi:hypothetical protein C7T94_07850 [Pedobacter yulinensis]|uniref:Uncharacterized protein n=1 Tax=Pedobacter yulinensis TaxID=2126353 RepID=A0A2T3HJK5_9SPHI|nr:hypothetical protein [Pedobacter yulinensis]PST82573.1 hypothetical protein C7T94_07850 [Pedobacter yulinensis]